MRPRPVTRPVWATRAGPPLSSGGPVRSTPERTLMSVCASTCAQCQWASVSINDIRSVATHPLRARTFSTSSTYVFFISGYRPKRMCWLASRHNVCYPRAESPSGRTLFGSGISHFKSAGINELHRIRITIFNVARKFTTCTDGIQ